MRIANLLAAIAACAVPVPCRGGLLHVVLSRCSAYDDGGGLCGGYLDPGTGDLLLGAVDVRQPPSPTPEPAPPTCADNRTAIWSGVNGTVGTWVGSNR